MSREERTPVEAKPTVMDIVDRELGTHIENIVQATGHEELRPVIRNFFARYFVIGMAIKEAKDPEAFETQIDKTAALLEKRIKEESEKVTTKAEKENKEIEERKSELIKAYNEVDQTKSKLRVTDDLGDPEFEEIQRINEQVNKASVAALRATYGVMEGLGEVQDILTSIERSNLERAFNRFKWWRIIRKWKQALYRIFLAIMVFGLGWGLLTSTANKLLLQIRFELALVFTIAAIAFKEYFISPWIKKKRLNQQRQDLLKNFTNFMDADLNYFLRSYMKNQRMKREATAITATMMQEVRKDFSTG